VKRKSVKENLGNIRLAFGINVIALLQDLMKVLKVPEMLPIVTLLLPNKYLAKQESRPSGRLFLLLTVCKDSNKRGKWR
jgi:hypothetical protein